MSRSASDLFLIAVRLAGFDAAELMHEIHRRVGRRSPERINAATVEAAMGAVRRRYE